MAIYPQKRNKTIDHTHTMITYDDAGKTLINTSSQSFTIGLPIVSYYPDFDCLLINSGTGTITCSGKEIAPSMHAHISNHDAESWDVSVSGGEPTEEHRGVYVYTAEDFPPEAEDGDILNKVGDYSRFDVKSTSGNQTTDVSQEEIIEITSAGDSTLTLSASGVSAGCIKMILNSGSGLLTISGNINGESAGYLYPNEACRLFYNGTTWRPF